MEKPLKLLLLIAISLTACVPPGNYNRNDSSPVTHYRPSAQHNYELNIVDIDNNAIPGAKIEYVLRDNSKVAKKGAIITGLDGKAALSVDATADKAFCSITYYRSDFSFKVSADKYYPASDIIRSDYGSVFNATTHSPERDCNTVPQSQSKNITLYKPKDYFDQSFLNSDKDSIFRQRILAFIEVIKLQNSLTDFYLASRSISVEDFKNKKYLRLKFVNGIVYNSLKENKYDIAKHLFDEVIRKTLTPLNEHISDTKKFYGYDLTVIGYTKNFADNNSSNQAIEYRFLIPESAVKSYKDKDISGQQLLDKSVVLMNDERIDLKLWKL